MREQIQSAVGFVTFLVMCLGAQLTGSFLTVPAVRSGWYSTLAKPAFTLPEKAFGPVWTILFFTMAVAAWLVWRKGLKGQPVNSALLLFFVQLILNVLWPALFFSMQRPGLAMAEIVLFWLLVLATVYCFFRIYRWAGLLLVPYLGWVLYAAILNGSIWWLNRGLNP